MVSAILFENRGGRLAARQQALMVRSGSA